MRKKALLFIVLGIVILLATWSYTGRQHAWKSSELAIDVQEIIGNDASCQKNIVAIQPYMFTEDYLSENHFYEKLKGYFEQAREAGYFQTNTVVLLPEYLGTWLAIAEEKTSVAKASSFRRAMAIMVASNPLRIMRYLFQRSHEKDHFAAAIFRMKAEEMARIYSTSFKELAANYHVTVVAGSIVLPGPRVEHNEIVVDITQPLYNTSFVFRPDGTIDPQTVRKSFPIQSEIPFLQAAPINELPSFKLPVGNTAILVCADSWYPESYERIDQLQADVVLVPAYCTGNGVLVEKWNGYNGVRRPLDVDTLDIQKITEQEAMVKYSLPGRIKTTKAPVGVNVFLRGELWDLGTDGQPFFVYNKQLIRTRVTNRAGIWNFCFH